MRKYLYIIAFLLSTTLLSAQESLFLERNKVLEVGVGYNGNGWTYDNINGTMLVLNIYGVHFDFGNNSEGNHENNIGVDKYSGYQMFTWHLGYSLPICDWLKITPVIGANKRASGYYDGGDYSFDSDGNVHNKFHPNSTLKGFDYGVVVTARFAKCLMAYVNIERHNIGVGIGFSLKMANTH